MPRRGPTGRSGVGWPRGSAGGPAPASAGRRVIENVLKIVNPPTNSEMNAKTSSAVEKNDSALLMALDCSFATVWPVTTCTPAAAPWRWRSAAAALLTPGLGKHVDVVDCPDLAEELCAVGRSKPAIVAPARLSAVPNVTMPVIVNVCGGPVEQDADVVARRRSGTSSPCRVDHDVVGGRRGRARDESQRRQLRIGVERQADGRGAAGADRPCRRGRRTGRSPRPCPSRTPRRSRHGPWLAIDSGIGVAHAVAALADERCDAADLEVDVLVDLPNSVLNVLAACR